MNTNHTDADAEIQGSDLARLEHDLAQHRRALKYLRLMAGSRVDLSSTRQVGPALDPDNNDAAELLARYRHIVAAERRSLRLIARARLR